MTPTRLVVGFIAGFVSVLTFQSGLIAIFHALGAIPFAPWRMTPVPPLGVPQSLSAAFWGGLWGIAYALLEPRLTARVGWWLGGLAFGAVLPVLVLWFVVLPLKGQPVGGGVPLAGVVRARPTSSAACVWPGRLPSPSPIRALPSLPPTFLFDGGVVRPRGAG